MGAGVERAGRLLHRLVLSAIIAGWYRCVVATTSPSTRHAVHPSRLSRVQIAPAQTAKPIICPKSKRTGSTFFTGHPCRTHVGLASHSWRAPFGRSVH